MSPQVALRAFDPFLATPSDGRARIDAQPGCGTTVKLYLPHHHGVVPPETATGLSELNRAERGDTALVVGDEPVVRDLIGGILDDLGYTASRVADAGAGLD
ncbi:hypothetical protein MKL09_09725 [Methylobacterium sp. J-048]|uniref:hypothetical protein n=1 Tax=Methylobacterium sp. J-048 TaxID=2836635 RepID=UPI001FBBBCE2|nr:hypothetical protein [Methylobacterium sp. J-048]MCJ2056832.1 hypothetical protein [Methylobacterium sp. J-048]